MGFGGLIVLLLVVAVVGIASLRWTIAGYGDEVMAKVYHGQKIAEGKFDMTEEWTEFHVTSPKLNKDILPASITFHIAFGKAEFWIDNVRFFEGDYVAPDGKPKSVQIENKQPLKWGNIKSNR